MARQPIGLQVTARTLREAQGITTAASLARRITAAGYPVSAEHVRNVELGHKVASPALLKAWADVLQVERLDLFQPPVRVKTRRRSTKAAA